MKQDRIELRASQKERARLLEAAFFSGVSLSAFLRQAALEKSEDVLKHKDNLTLSDNDRDVFLDALENPPKPNKRLQQAFKKYIELKGSTKTQASAKPRTKRAKSLGQKVR